MTNLIIIGNGFDLAHGLETSYEDFVRYLINNNCKEIKHSKLFQNVISVSDYDWLKLRTPSNRGSIIEGSNIKNLFLKSLLKDFVLQNWCDIEEKYFDLLIKIKGTGAVYTDPFTLNGEFEILKSHLSDYLKEQEDRASAIESYSIMFQKLDLRDTLILNFNYTNTLQRFYSKSMKYSRIIHIHGETKDTVNPMVFGYAATNEDARKLIGKKENEYLRFIKKHLYKQSDNESLLLDYLKVTKQIDVSILGHSCGLSDNLILEQILNNENINSIRTFYYENYERYFQNQVNIDRIMNNDDRFTKLIVDFKSSHRMPQHNDSKSQSDDFIDYIENLRLKQDKERPKRKTAVGVRF